MSYTVTLYFDNMVDETQFLRKRRRCQMERLSSRASIEKSDV